MEKFEVKCQGGNKNIVTKSVKDDEALNHKFFEQEINYMDMFNYSPHFAKVYFDIKHKQGGKNFHLIGMEMGEGGDLVKPLSRQHLKG